MPAQTSSKQDKTKKESIRQNLQPSNAGSSWQFDGAAKAGLHYLPLLITLSKYWVDCIHRKVIIILKNKFDVPKPETASKESLRDKSPEVWKRKPCLTNVVEDT